MKYLIEAIKKSKAWIFMFVYLATQGIYIWLNAEILMLISQVCEAATKEEAITLVNQIIILCIIQTVFSLCDGFAKHGRDKIFTYLSNLYSDKICDADVSLFDKFSPGIIMNAGGKIWKISVIPMYIIATIKILITLIINLIVIFTLVPIHIFLIIVICFIIMGVVSMIINNYMNKIDIKANKFVKERDVELDEISNGFMEARSFAYRQNRHKDSIHMANKNIMKTFTNKKAASASFSASIELLVSVAFIAALLYVIATDEIQGASGVALVMYIFRLIDPLISLIDIFCDMSEVNAALPDFVKIMDYQNTMQDGNIILAAFESEISIDNISFSYNKSDIVLNDISMRIPKGANIGICGTSGGGKSTLMKLIPRFYDPDSGSIKIDGIDIKELNRDSLMKFIGIVNQSIFIFDGSIKDNISYAGNFPESELIEACKKANIWEFIQSLPDGLDTKVGPRGLKLSGGQKQRISIARVFLTNPEIILLDEATAALDNESEKAVQDALKAFKGKTIITIAHRLSTIKDCDCIYVINNHTIAEKGTHNELISKKGEYYKLAH